jgi:heme/copper-type cytochrome/quinol oxidase subunit 2
MRGRMQGVFIVVVAGGPRLGDLRAGAIASAASVSAAMVSGGVFVVVAMAVVALLVPSFWLFRASRSAQESVATEEARPGSPAPESGEDRPGSVTP